MVLTYPTPSRYPNQPDNFGGGRTEECMEFYGRMWNDVRCDEVRDGGAVCEYAMEGKV